MGIGRVLAPKGQGGIVIIDFKENPLTLKFNGAEVMFAMRIIVGSKIIKLADGLQDGLLVSFGQCDNTCERSRP